ncbi:N-acylneuraminate cytidylyltransferase [Malaciobacter mytili LMG 24559]|uniref:N-acylneuraminate cytidylyltransferase n=1 Tax=Malaciobacter mytili LMG 24559 TaxID=1032238 RepID=A0AAX2AG96_9BACT|nr:acylneuraminate cytidylyltransferase family protein [Malaciobacter mytili]AXH14491.1 acylneuraminate cytidylyltransferase family protein [Malaciobacter mytili LMG 24559]RXK13708.1 N-acylneuraminate cytidylyltransferase [Malaciobacter mytili LMG 24559]
MIAIVPARGGSKGLPGKNIKDLCGKPMIAYTIEEALKSKYITEVIISTDCKEIEEIAIKYGAKSPFLRPSFLASDTALAIDNYIYTIDRLNKDFNYNIKDFVVLQPTSPLRKKEDIDGAIELFKNKKAHSVISYTEEHHPLQWHKYINEDGTFENIFKDTIQNRQEIKKSYYPNGAVFVFNYDLIKAGKYFSDNSYAYIMPRNRSIDVDTIEDFMYIEYLLKGNNINV